MHPHTSWILTALACLAAPLAAADVGQYWICVSNEHGGYVTVIDGATNKVISTIPVGKRPRGIHPSPDGATLYVALSGRPIEGPPQLDAKGNPILHKNDDDDDDARSDHAADGIGVVDLKSLKFLKKIPAGSDPEQFAVAPDGKHLYTSNEDVATISSINLQTEKVDHIVPVGKEPEGVVFTPDGKSVYCTCETNGDVFSIDVSTSKVSGHFTVPPRPRNLAFLPDGSLGFAPSESSGQLTTFNPATHQILKTVRLPAGSRPMGMAINPLGNKLYVSTGRAGTVLVINPQSLETQTTIKVGQRPWGLALSPDAHYLYVANGPSNDLSVIDLQTEKELTRIKVGQGPWGVTVVTPPAPSPQ